MRKNMQIALVSSLWLGCGQSAGLAGELQGGATLTRPIAAASLKQSPAFVSGLSEEVVVIQVGQLCGITTTDSALVSDLGRIQAQWFRNLQRITVGGLATIRDMTAKDWPSNSAYFDGQIQCNPMIGKWVISALTLKGKAIADANWHQISENTYNFVSRKRIFGNVTGIINSTPTEAHVEYTWQWTPTPAGVATGYSTDTLSATAIFRKYDDGWRLLASGLE
jgi:hypothetical protein